LLNSKWAAPGLCLGRCSHGRCDEDGYENSLSGAVIELKNGKITIASRAAIKQNETRKAGEQKLRTEQNQATVNQVMGNISSGSGGAYNPYH